MKESHRNFLDRPVPASILMGLIILSVISFSLGTLPDLSPDLMQTLRVFEYVVVAIFTAEYLYRLATAEHKLKFIFSFYGMVDLLAIAPFYLTMAVDLRSLRVIRLLRFLRLLKMARYNSAINRLYRAFYEAKQELLISLGILLVAIYFSAIGIYYFEHDAQPEVFRSIFDALWWALITVTTVGYGDIYPVTVGGRLFTFIVLFCSMGLVAVPTGIFASALLAVRRSADDGAEP